MAIYVTGDCHAEFRKFSTVSFPKQKRLGRDDYMIILGDFGGVWDWRGETKEEKYWLDWLDDKPYTTLFICGNHENFERLYAYPEEEWRGGMVHKVRPGILHLMRGYVFDIQGKTFFAFGGARSHDVSGGILEPEDPNIKKKIRRLDENMECYRINHRSWWKEEMPNQEEKERGIRNLAEHGNKVDFILSHDCPVSTQKKLDMVLFGADELNEYLEGIMTNTEYRYWFSGHYHVDRRMGKDMVLYDRIIQIL